MKQTELERKLIFTILQGNEEAQEKIFAELEPEHFTIDEARKVFVIASALHTTENSAVDFAMIQPRIDEKTNDFIFEIIRANPFVTAEQVSKYIPELHRLKRCRDAAAAARAAAKALEEGDESAIFELQNRLEKSSAAGGSLQLVTLADAMHNAISALGDTNKSSIKTGFYLIDDYFDGVKAGRLAILAAETGKGKSALAANIALNVARTGGIVLYVSLEMQAEQIAERARAILTGISKQDAQRAAKKQDSATLEKIIEANELVTDKRIVFFDKGSITAPQIVNLIRQVKAAYGACDLVIVDYLQLLESSRKSDTRERQIADISRTLAAAALAENTCIFALSQVNRQVDQREGSELFISDIRESAAPSHDASGVFMLYPVDDDEAEQDEAVIPMKLKLEKNRNGKTGHATIYFNKPLQRFTDPQRAK